MKNFNCALTLAVALYASSAQSQTFKTLIQFSGTGGAALGANPSGSLTLSGTRLYGLTEFGGANGFGNLFSLGTDGAGYQNLIVFTGSGGSADGFHPHADLTLSGTTLYGMNVGASAGPNGAGNVFSVGTDGTNYRTVISFTGTGGAASGLAPFGSLTLSGTTLYGMTDEGGAGGYGNVFSVGTGGTNYQNLLSFTGTGGAASGASPGGNLALGGTTLYGMTALGGSQGFGNIVSIGTDGTGYRNLISFTGTGGAATGQLPGTSLTLSGTTVYGMTGYGGANNDGTIFSIGLGGTNFESLLSFTGTGGAASGMTPYGSLTLSGTTLYGMTSSGGVHSAGNIFSVGIDGSGYQDLYDFTGGADGGEPNGDLTLSGGTLFGMTLLGGTNLSDHGGNGTIFALTLPTPEPGTLALLGALGSLATFAALWLKRRGR